MRLSRSIIINFRVQYIMVLYMMIGYYVLYSVLSLIVIHLVGAISATNYHAMFGSKYTYIKLLLYECQTQ